MENLKTQTQHKHSLIARMFHWSFLGLFIYGILKGLDNVNQLADASLLQFEMIFAGSFLVVLLARFLFMRKRQSALPESTPKPVSFLAKSVHLGLYAFPALIALSGLTIGGLYMIGITGGPLMSLVIAFHEFSILSSYVLIGAHVAAAIGHRILGDGVWSSMVPFLKEKRANT